MQDSSWCLYLTKQITRTQERGLSGAQAPTEEKEALAAHKRWLKASNGGMDPKQDYYAGRHSCELCLYTYCKLFGLSSAQAPTKGI